MYVDYSQVLAGVEVVSPMSTKKAIIMTHYNHGSLLEYLTSHILRWDEMYKLMLSLANGVAFIHGEIDEYGNLSFFFHFLDLRHNHCCESLIVD